MAPQTTHGNLRCPDFGCGGEMQPDPMPALDGTGLQCRRCLACGHRGFVPKDGIQFLFSGHHEHVCRFGPSPLTLTVLFTNAALALFGGRGLSPAEAAGHVARWALLNGQVAGSVQMFLECSALPHCYDYLCAHVLPDPARQQPARTSHH